MSIDPPDLTVFRLEVEALCRLHGVSISVDYPEGSLILVPFDEDDMRRLRQAEWIPNERLPPKP